MQFMQHSNWRILNNFLITKQKIKNRYFSHFYNSLQTPTYKSPFIDDRHNIPLYINKDSSRELCFDVCYKINWMWGIFQSNTKCCQSKMSTHIHGWKSSKMNCILSWWGPNNREKGKIPWKVNRYLMKSRPLNIGAMLKKGCNKGAKIWRDIVPLFFSVCLR